MKIKAVTFDLWETLIFERAGSTSLRNSLRCLHLTESLRELGLNVSFEQVSSAIKEASSSLTVIWETNRDISHFDQLRLIYGFISKEPLTLEEEWVKKLSQAFISPLFEVPSYINPDAYSVLDTLRKQELKIGLISNTGITPGVALREYLEKEHLVDFFDDMIFSEEVGIRKPDPRIFYLAAKRLGIKAFQIVHVGDNLKNDVWGAKNAGFKTVYLSSLEGRDSVAESDPTSLVSISRKMDDVTRDQAKADIEVKRLPEVIGAIKRLEA